MGNDARNRARSLKEISAAIVERLRPRQADIAQAVYTRIRDAVPDPVGDQDPEYEAGLLMAVTSVIGYCFDAIEQGPGWSEPIPSAAAAQARRAARSGVSLGTIQRRYIAGHRELGEFITRETERNGFSNNNRQVLHYLRRTQEALLEHLAAAIEHEYNQAITGSLERRRVETVRRMLAGEPVDPAELAELNYEPHALWHLGIIATGTEAIEILGRLKAGLGRKLLSVPYGEGSIWVWLGGQEKLAVTDIEHLLSADGHLDVSLAVGEPGRGIEGWRLTHYQAREACLVAMCKPQKLTRYADNRLLAAAVWNETLAKSLKQKYLAPLRSQRDGGAVLRQTLRAYIDAGCAATSAAHPLNVDRHTVQSRVRTVEGLIGCPLRDCLPELDVALRLEELDNRATTPNDSPAPQ